MPLEIVTSVVSVGTINQKKDISKKFSAIQFPLLIQFPIHRDI